MDILNWLHLVKNKLVKTTVQDPEKDLVILGGNVTYAKRGDKYQSYGMTVQDFAAAVGGLKGESYILVKGDSPDPVVNGAELKAAYDIALAATPYGDPKGIGNEFSVIIGPGTYDMRAYNTTFGWELTGDYINMISLTGEPDVIISTFCVGGDFGTYKGLNAAAASSVGLGNGQILLGSDTTFSIRANFENCKAGDYSFGAAFGIGGRFKNCTAGGYSFGCAITSVPPGYIMPPQDPNILSGVSTLYITGSSTPTVFENCTAGNYSFGSYGGNNNVSIGIFGVNFNNCTAYDYSFGSAATNCTINFDTFTNCTAYSSSFGSSLIGDVTIFLSKFVDCQITSSGFARSIMGNVTISGSTFDNCRTTSGGNAFACTNGSNASATIDGSTFNNCIVDGGSPGFAFGSSFDTVAGGTIINSNSIFNNCKSGYISFGVSGGAASVYGTFNNCEARGYSFGYNPTNYNANAAGTFTNCKVTLGMGGPGEGAFGANMASGVFTNCMVFGVGNRYAFGFGQGVPGQEGTANGSFYNCITTIDYCFGVYASGVFMNCKSFSFSFGAVDATGYFYNCVAALYSFGAKPIGNVNGTFINCAASTNSFGNNDATLVSKLNGKAFYCVKDSGSFYTSVGGTKAVLCIDGTNTIKTL